MNSTPGMGGPAGCEEAAQAVYRTESGAKREPDRAKRQTTVGPTLIKEMV